MSIALVFIFGPEILVLVILSSRIALSYLESSVELHNWVKKEANALQVEHARVWQHYRGLCNGDQPNRTNVVIPFEAVLVALSRAGPRRFQGRGCAIRDNDQSSQVDIESSQGMAPKVPQTASNPTVPSPQASSSAVEASSSADFSRGSSHTLIESQGSPKSLPHSDTPQQPLNRSFTGVSTRLNGLLEPDFSADDSNNYSPSTEQRLFAALASKSSSSWQCSGSSSSSGSPSSSATPSPSEPSSSPSSPSTENSDDEKDTVTPPPRAYERTLFFKETSFKTPSMAENLRHDLDNGSGFSKIQELLS